MTDHWDALAEQIADAAFKKFAVRIDAYLEKVVRSQIKLTFSETEAAKQLGVSRDTVAAWRKNALISYARYPQAKRDGLSDMHSYSAADILNFRERYLIRVPAKNVYEISPVLSLAGAEVRKAA